MDTSDLLDKYRYVLVEHSDWSEYVIEHFVERMEEVGIHVTRDNVRKRNKVSVFFSGFGSQGDGACFNGGVADWDKFLIAHGIYDINHVWLKTCDTYAQWYQSGHYYHEKSLGYELDTTSNAESDLVYLEDECSTDLITAIHKVQYDSFNMVSFENELQEIVEGYCKELYKELEDEYEYLTSDEVVLEWINENVTLEEEQQS